jgi:aminobenzoyl-glutamate transport protein
MTARKNAGGGLITRMLGTIETVGNKLPHPATLFAIFAGATIILSAIVSAFDISVVHPGTMEEIQPFNLLSVAGLHMILTGMVVNFTSFAPLGTVLVALLGIGVMESSGFMSTALRKLCFLPPGSFSPLQ